MRRMNHTLGRPVFRLAGYLLAITLSSCSSTHVVTAWRDPATSQIMFTKILALVIGGDQASVRAGEDDLCHQVKRVPCKPAYLAMPDSMRSDIPAAKALVQIQYDDVGSAADEVIAEFRERFVDTELFFDPFAGAKFANYLFAAHENAGRAMTAESARVLIAEAQLFIEAVHACYNKIRSAGLATTKVES